MKSSLINFLKKPLGFGGAVRFLHSQVNVAVKEKPVEEFTLNVPWGHISGKWWGSKNVRPILALHGWQDSASTFDTLIPLLPDHVGYLAIDFPGHGLSSHFPPGIQYSTLDLLCSIELIRKHFQWDHLSILAHSLGSKFAYYYLSLYPELCDMVIGIDILKPLYRSPKQLITDKLLQIERLVNEIEHNTTTTESTTNKSEPPSYTMDELIELTYKGSMKSVTREAAPYLLDRAIQKSIINPDKYYFRRDNRLKAFDYAIINHDLNKVLAERIKAPHLFIKAADSPHWENPKYYFEIIELLKKNPNFRLIDVPGTHYVHLTEPTKICNQISSFINEHRSAV